jgi:hypothetical protein
MPKAVNMHIALCIITCTLVACGQKGVPEEMYGSWTSSLSPVTVRTEPSRMKFEFHKDSIIIEFTIKEDKTARGTIGGASFEGAVKTNWILPVEMTGVAFTIKCPTRGPLFENDPLPAKYLELWVGPMGDTLVAELRYTENGAHFPMGEFVFTRKEID